MIWKSVFEQDEILRAQDLRLTEISSLNGLCLLISSWSEIENQFLLKYFSVFDMRAI